LLVERRTIGSEFATNQAIVRLTGSVYRADHPAHTDLARTTAASRDDPGRFNTSRLGAVYLSLEPETAIKESQESDELPQCALFVMDASLARVVDLTDPTVRERWQLTMDDLQSDDVARCQEAAEAAAAAGEEAIVWPSATGEGRSLAVFADRLAHGSRLEIVHAFELSQTAVRSIIAGTPISSLVPLLRR
jgi:RES domain-containing protein